MRVAAMYDVTPALLDRLQPWLAEIALAGGAYHKAGADAASGVEKTISAAARPQAERHAFETPAEQIGSLVKAWIDGDMPALDREAISEMRKAAPTLFRTLVTDRNIRWTKMLDQRLKGHGHTVVVVGV